MWKRMHQTIGNVLRTLLHVHIFNTNQELHNIVDKSLATAMYTLRVAVSPLLNYHSPGTLTFHWDMLLSIPFQVDLQAIQQKQQLLINQNLICANAKWRDYNYHPGQ